MLRMIREAYLGMLLEFLGREWAALGAGGWDRSSGKVMDPEALMLFTSTLGRYDGELFDMMLGWLAKNGRFVNVQRVQNIAKREALGDAGVLGAIADWMVRTQGAVKWKTLIGAQKTPRSLKQLFLFPEDQAREGDALDPVFEAHGYRRREIVLRADAECFPAYGENCLFLSMRALMGVNSRADILTYLALNGAGYPRELARELYYSAKSIHVVMRDMACSGVVTGSRERRERMFQITASAVPFLDLDERAPMWINWPVLLSAAEGVWRLTDRVYRAGTDAEAAEREIAAGMGPYIARLAATRWGVLARHVGTPDGMEVLNGFGGTFKGIVG